MIITSVCVCPWFNALSTSLARSWTNWTSWASKGLRVWNLYWQSARMLSETLCLLIFLTIICSRVLQQMHVSDILLHFLNTGAVFACRQSHGTEWHVNKYKSYIFLTFTLAFRLSGTNALRILNFSHCFFISLESSVISPMMENGLVPVRR